MLVMGPEPFEHFSSFSSRRLCIKSGYNWLGRYRGDAWNCLTTRVLDQKSKNDLDLLYSQIFINSFGKLSIPILSQHLKTICMKSSVPAFAYI